MRKICEKIIIALMVVMVLVVLYIVFSGFTKVSDAFIGEYSISEDGKEMIIQVGVAGSIGFIRSVDVTKQEGGILYLDCYSAFGGFNGSLGARDKYVIPIEEDTNVIALYRNNNKYEMILKKEMDGNWVRVGFGNYLAK